MASLKLDLLENSIDSLNEALAKYQSGNNGDVTAYKFCIQHLAHFFELILKYYVTQSHPLLIYRNPFSKSINLDTQTIGLNEAINFLKNEGLVISDKFEKDINWLKKLRNNIEHHKFSMDISEVQETIGRLISAVVDFDDSHEKLDLSGHIAIEQYELFHQLAKTYEKQLEKAEQSVEKYLDSTNPMEDSCEIYHCNECDHDTMIPDSNSASGHKCTFCGNEESDDIEVDCRLCGTQWPMWQMKWIDWADTGNYDHYCPRCLHHPDYVKDD